MMSAYVHKSGAQKRKKQKLKDVNDNREISQLRRIDNFFEIPSSSNKSHVQPEKIDEHRIIDVALAEQHQEIDHVNPATALTPAVPGVVTPAPLIGSGERSEENFSHSGDNRASVSSDSTVCEYDIGHWGDLISEEARCVWIQRGSTDCRHINNGFENSSTVQGQEKLSRSCSLSLFTRVHSLTGERIDRSWLCYSPTTGCLFCFACKLLSTSATKMTSGFNDWKNADAKLASHENSLQHRSAMIALCSRKAATGRVDVGLTEQFETECQYWRMVLHRVVNVVQFLCERGLAFRGRDEIVGSNGNGNYLGILK
jgi:hypothetical protein